MTHSYATDAVVSSLPFEEPAEDGGTGALVTFYLPGYDLPHEVSAWIHPETGKLHVDVMPCDYSETNDDPSTQVVVTVGDRYVFGPALTAAPE